MSWRIWGLLITNLLIQFEATFGKYYTMNISADKTYTGLKLHICIRYKAFMEQQYI